MGVWLAGDYQDGKAASQSFDDARQLGHTRTESHKHSKVQFANMI